MAEASEGPRIAVVGAGIAGLAAGAALHRAGVDVTVFEQARALGEVGAGVSLTRNSLRVLDDLDLMPALDREAVHLAHGMVLYGQTGDRLGGPGRAGDGRNVHRADLVEVLRSPLPADRVRLSSKLASVTPAGE